MTDLDKGRGLDTEPIESESHNGLQGLKTHARALDAELFGWAGRVGMRRHQQWLVAPCDQDPRWTALLAAMIERHPAREQGWLLHTAHGAVLVPGYHTRVPEAAEKVRVVRAGLFPLGPKWQPFEDWFCTDSDGVVWANDMATRAVDMMTTNHEVARYAAEALVAARTSTGTV